MKPLSLSRLTSNAVGLAAAVLIMCMGFRQAFLGAAATDAAIAVFIVFFGGILLLAALQGLRRTLHPSEHEYTIIGRGRMSVEDRLDELERLKRRDMVTAEEYAAKRQDILNDL